MGQDLVHAFDLSETYVFLEDGGAAPMIAGGSTFWRTLMTGPPLPSEIDRVANSGGWLAAQYAIEADAPAWERHPNGDELLIMLTGTMAVVLEEGAGERVVEVPAGSAILVPTGTWRRQLVRRVGTYLGITYGRGTEHRPL